MKEEIGPALGKIPSGVGILTAKIGSEELAMLASWFQQVAFEPPMITVAVNKSRPIANVILESKSFCLNLLHTNQKDLMGHFAKGTPGTSPFQGIATQKTHVGGIILSDAMSYLDCQLISKMEASDHWILLGQIMEGRILNDGTAMVHMRRNGFHY